jgi:hypothetical protein
MSRPVAKNISLPFFVILWSSSAHPAFTERGVSRSSRTWKAGSGGRSRMCSALALDDTSESVRRNRAVPIPRRWDQALRDERQGDGGQTARRAEEITYKPSNHCAGNAGLFRLPCRCLRAQSALFFARKARGAASIRCSPRPLCFWEGQ